MLKHLSRLIGHTENVSILITGSLNTWAATQSLTADPIRSAMLSERTLQLELHGRIFKKRPLADPVDPDSR